MSGGISTGAPYALLDARGMGFNLDTYSYWGELTEQTLYLHAVQARGTDGAGTSYGPAAMSPTATEAEYCDAYLARLEALVARVRQRVVENWDPVRLRAPEVWPFRAQGVGTPIHAERWYGFYEGEGVFLGTAGGTDKKFDAMQGGGWASLAEARDAFEADDQVKLPPEDWASDAELLGAVRVCFLTGRAYVDRLYQLCGPGGSGWDLTDYGKWSAAPAPTTVPGVFALKVEVPYHPELKLGDVKEGVRCALQGYPGSILTSAGGAKLSPTCPAITSLINRAKVL